MDGWEWDGWMDTLFRRILIQSLYKVHNYASFSTIDLREIVSSLPTAHFSGKKGKEGTKQSHPIFSLLYFPSPLRLKPKPSQCLTHLEDSHWYKRALGNKTQQTFVDRDKS